MRWYRSIKMTLGFALAIAIAHLLGLDFPLSAGIIGVLNMLDTKRASARVAWRRLYASALGLVLAGLMINLWGTNQWLMIPIVGLFIPMAFKMNAREGIAVHIVLTSHIIQYSSLTPIHLLNEYLLVVIGAGVALTLNIHMPNKEKNLLMIRSEVEKAMRIVISDFVCALEQMCVLEDSSEDLDILESKIKGGKAVAYTYMNNYYFKDNPMHLEYFQMRLLQVDQLRKMKTRVGQTIFNQDEVHIISDLVSKMGDLFNYKYDGYSLIEDIEERRLKMDGLALPTSHLELKQRSALMEFMNDLEAFVLYKVRFSIKYNRK